MRSAQTCPPFTGFTQLCTSVSTFAINIYNRMFLCSCLQVCRPVTRSIIGSSPSSCSGVWDPWSAEYQSCTLAMLLQRTEAETGFVPTSAQFFAVGTFLILRSPSWTRSCIQKYRVSMCFVRCPAPNRSVKEFAVEQSLGISIFIGIPRSWYIDLRDNPA